MSCTKTTISQSWEELTFSNNFLFCKILESDREICRKVLEILLHEKIEKLEEPQAEKTMLETPDSRGVRFDVYVKNSEQVFDVEMQTTIKSELPKRTRYYQSTIDMDSLSKGENYMRLKDSYVIFLCLKDPFTENLPVYFFENTCRTGEKRKLGDGAYKVFFNAAEYDKMESGEEKAFFKYLVEQKAEDELTKSLEKRVSFARKNMEWRKQYMTWQQTLDEEKSIAFAEGIERGEYNAKNNIAKDMLSDGLDVKQVAKYTGLSVEILSKNLQEEKK